MLYQMHNITIENNKIIEIIIVLFVQLILSILECNFLKTGYISFCRLCFLMKGMQSRCLSIYVKIDAYFNRKGSFSKSKQCGFILNYKCKQMWLFANVFFKSPSLDVNITTKLFSSGKVKMCVKKVKDILYIY